MTVKQSIAGIIAAAAIGGGVYEGTVSDGPVDVVRPGELVSQRTETAVVYDAGNGKRRAEVHTKPVHWRDGKTWKTIDTAVKAKPILRQLFSDRDYETTAGPYTADYETDKPYNYRMVANGATVAYMARFDTTKAVTVTVEPTTTGVKETVILADETAPTRLDWTVETDAVFTARGDGGFNADGLVIEPPVAWDANGAAVPVTVSLRDGVYTLVVETKGAAWPVTVDPTTSITAGRDGHVSVADRNATSGAADASRYRVGDTSGTYFRSFLSFIVSELDVISIDACSLYVNGNAVFGTPDDSLLVVGAASYRPTLDNGDFNEFNGWQAAGAYNGTKLTYGWATSTYSADWNIIIFTPAGMDSLEAAQNDTLWIAMLSASDYANGNTNEIISFESSAHATLDPYLSIGYTGYDYNTTYLFSESPGDFFTSKAKVSTTYATVRDMYDVVADPPDISTAAVDTLGQMKDVANNYHVWRANLEVYELPNMNYVDACTLKVNLTGDQSATDFNLQVYAGTWNEAQNADYRYWNFNGRQSGAAHNGVRLNEPWSTSSYSAGVLNLIFNADGKAALIAAAQDTLRLVIISSRDASNTAPTGNEFLTLNSTSAALAFSWRLNSTEPTGLTMTAVDTDSVMVTWTDNSLDETGFDIVETLTGDVITSVAADVTSVGVGGLLPNTLYSWRVQVDGGVYDDSLSVADSTYTLAVAPVVAPMLTFPTGTTAVVVIDTTGTGNPSYTEYAIQDSLSGLYVDADGDSFKAEAEWRTFDNWGGAAGDTLAVLTGKKYTIRVKARSGQ